MAVARFDGEVIDRGDYVVIRTPQNPTFYWGNFLIFPRPPERGDFAKWQAIHAREFPPHPGANTIFAWDDIEGNTGDDAEFVGFKRDLGWCMSAAALHKTAHFDPTLPVRTLHSDADWQSAERCLADAFAHKGSDEAVQRAFVKRQLVRYRAMMAAGWGEWFGAFAGDRVIGCAGLLRQDDAARFQLVGTDPAYGGRGVCSTLLYHMGEVGLFRWKKPELLIVGDASYHAVRVYRSLGFEIAERLATLMIT